METALEGDPERELGEAQNREKTNKKKKTSNCLSAINRVTIKSSSRGLHKRLKCGLRMASLAFGDWGRHKGQATTKADSVEEETKKNSLAVVMLVETNS